jgi:hypothetical protein
MTTPMARGYAITRTYDFVNSGYFTSQEANRIIDSIPADIRKELPNLKAGNWYPREYMLPLMRGIANVKNDDRGSYADLVAYGKAVASEATNTFLKLLMKMMTPSLFAKKFPDFYVRDHKGSGHFELAELDVKGTHDGKIGIRLVGAEGFDHIGAAAVGFFTFGMESIGGEGCIDVKLTGWSMKTPSPPEVVYEVRLR